MNWGRREKKEGGNEGRTEDWQAYDVISMMSVTSLSQHALRDVRHETRGHETTSQERTQISFFLGTNHTKSISFLESPHGQREVCGRSGLSRGATDRHHFLTFLLLLFVLFSLCSSFFLSLLEASI